MKSAERTLPALLALLLAQAAGGTDSLLAWRQDETSLALLHEDKTVWRLEFDPASPKSHFHPLATIEGRVLTAFEPGDHPWHRGLWWSWKFINGLNYWEEDPKTRASEGSTTLVRTQVEAADDFSARVAMDLHYHPRGQDPVLTEKRHLTMSKPDAGGSYRIDWESTFTAGKCMVKLDRTLPAHLGGVAWGGYAGLSLRLAKGLDGFSFRTHDGPTTAAATHGQAARWIDLADATAGIAILDHPANPRHAPPWYLHSDQTMLFLAPAPLFHEPLGIAPGESITFRHQVIVHSRPLTRESIEEQWRAFARTQPANP